MQIGVNSFTFESPFNTKSVGWIARAKEMGFDFFEISLEDPANTDVAVVRRAIEDAGLGVSTCCAFGPDRDISSDDPRVRQAAIDHIKTCIDIAHGLGADLLAGPMYSAVGKARFISDDERKKEWDRSVEIMRQLGEYAAQAGVRLAMEPLNRFENDMINTAEQALRYVQDVGLPNVGIHLDTFHMHIEEKDLGDAVRTAGDRLFHLHTCENDRGTPGTGQVAWQKLADALREIGYQGRGAIESFTPNAESVRQAACIWRQLAPSQEHLAQEGLKFLRRVFDF